MSEPRAGELVDRVPDWRAIPMGCKCVRRQLWHDSEELVYMWEKLAAFENASVSYPNFLDWRERNRSFEDLAAFNGGSLNLTGIDDPVEL